MSILPNPTLSRGLRRRLATIKAASKASKTVNNARLCVIVTGGTFDKDYDPVRGALGFRRTHVTEILRQANVSMEYIHVRMLFLKDSLDLTDEDRSQIVRSCRNAKESRIVAVHGTDTLLETAAWIALAQLSKVIVLVGAMVPFCCKNSDAAFNLGGAITAGRLLRDPGVYVAMNGQVFPWDNVRKNRELGRFEAVN